MTKRAQRALAVISDVDRHFVLDQVLRRLYHEDTLLTQRTYNFLTFNLLLVTIIIAGGSYLSEIGGLYASLISLMIVLFGAVMAGLQTFVGSRLRYTIFFWRQYAALIEAEYGVPIDHALFEVYSQGHVETPWGPIRERKARKPGSGLLARSPWKWMRSTNTILGIFLPYVVATVWLSAAAILFVRLRETIPLVPALAATLLVWIGFSVIIWVKLKPAYDRPGADGVLPV